MDTPVHVPHGGGWATDDQADWLRGEVVRLLEFARGAARPGGGFGWLDAHGALDQRQPVHTWVHSRMTHVMALGQLMGLPWCADLVDHGVAGFAGLLRDGEYDGWLDAEPGRGSGDKQAYAHAFVVLGLSSAAAAGHERGRELLDEALRVFEEHFWDEEAGAVVDVWDRPWSTLEAYRGANANMHSVEAMLAAADVTGDPVWRARALRVTEKLVHGFARGNDWLMPEHYDPQWRALPEYNTDRRADQFRPYGATIGHLLEWSRLALHVSAALGEAAPAWLADDSAALFETAVRDGWSVDGDEGFVYTVDWQGRPVVRDRLHWVVCEGISAAAAARTATGDGRYAAWYDTWWSHARARYVDLEGGSWWHETTPDGRPSTRVWDGKPDVYHAVTACLVPLLPLAPTAASALAAGARAQG